MIAFLFTPTSRIGETMSNPSGHAEERIQVLDAIVKASDSYVEVVTLIAEASDENEALAALKERLGVSESGARAVMEMQFRRLTPNHRQRVREQLDELKSQV